MKILITGGAGFIGSHLVDLCIKENNEIIVLDNLETGNLNNIKSNSDKIIFIKEDISNLDNILPYFEKVDIVIHLAALADIVPSITNPNRYFEVNVNGTKNVMESCRIHKVRKVIYAASSSCYGIGTQYPTPEDAAIKPEYPYAFTKYLGEQIVLHWGSIYNFDVTSLRFFNVYGTRSRTKGAYGAVFGVFLAQKLAGEPLTIVGDGTQTRDFTYVTDVASAIFTAAQATTPETIYNIGSGTTVSINEIVKLLDHSSINIPRRPGEPDCTFADITKFTRDTNWLPIVKIDDGVKTMLDNIKLWADAPVWTEKSIEQQTKDWFMHLE